MDVRDGMEKLLIIADDFTGALDTGVQFAVRGARTCVVTDPAYDFARAGEEVQVLVLDAETRHLTPEAAYRTVFRAVGAGLAAGFQYIYKKTDSALRGNVGAELSAALDAAGAERLHFLPAMPKTNRVTRNGVHYIDGVPVAESVFGQDPFEPVSASAVAEIIGAQSDTPVVLHPLGEDGPEARPGIQVYDAETEEDLRRIGGGGGRGGGGPAPLPGEAARRVVAADAALRAAGPRRPEEGASAYPFGLGPNGCCPGTQNAAHL